MCNALYWSLVSITDRKTPQCNWPIVACRCVSFLFLPAQVALIVEVTEEDDEGDAVTKHHQVHGVWKVALCKQVVAGV